MSAPNKKPAGAPSPKKPAISNASPTKPAISNASPTKSSISTASPTKHAISNASPTKSSISTAARTKSSISTASPKKATISTASPNKAKISAATPSKSTISPTPGRKSGENQPAKSVSPPVNHLQDVLDLKSEKDVRKKATDVRNALKMEFEKTTKNYSVLDDLLEAGKVVLVKLFSPTQTSVVEGDAILARDILEYGAKISVEKKSEVGLMQFEAYVAQLKHYYLDLKSVLKTPSESMYEILGMNLMYLLSRNMISTFHVELETFIHPDVKAVLNNVYVKKAVEIEQYLTDGRFNKILALHLASEDDLKKEGLNSVGFKFFIDRIFEYSRENIADVMESSAESISVNKAQSKLHIQGLQALIAYCQKRKWEFKKSDGKDQICFTKHDNEGKTLPSLQLAQDSIFYAKELDTIV